MLAKIHSAAVHGLDARILKRGHFWRNIGEGKRLIIRQLELNKNWRISQIAISSIRFEMKSPSILTDQIQNSILIIREQRVMLDRDLAQLYGVTTMRLNEQVKRNIDRFPEDFRFQLTKEEKDWVVANCDHLQKLKFSRTTPYAFTEHGVVMLASILNTKLAVQTSILVVRAFVYLRKSTSTNQELAEKINELEAKYDTKFGIVFRALKQLIDKPDPPRNRIGFHREQKKE